MTKASCSICTKEKSFFFLGHRQLCFRCDELLIDLEMEIEAEATAERAAEISDELEIETQE